jgi:hypothetical protein
MPWAAKSDAGKLGPGVPKSDCWASDKQGIEQVGCVYTVQGFEFDYVGVIFGPDLVYRPMDGGWVGQLRISRVLATRFHAKWPPRFAGNGHPVSRVMATPS